MIADKNRGIRIVQTTVEEAQENYISAYFDRFEFEGYDNILDELVIDLVLSEETKEKAVEWMKEWLVEGIGSDLLDSQIKGNILLAVE
jgi:hypothetical protein